jgi:hypothetical protein
MKDILVVMNGENSETAVKEAFCAARSGSRKVKVLQILDSGLYHYGHHDLLYIREQVLEQGRKEAERLSERAGEMGICLDITPVETDDVISTVIAEAEKGYDTIYLPKEEKKLFPIFKKTMARYLKGKVPGRIISCSG